jgi:hypothetical protein
MKKEKSYIVEYTKIVKVKKIFSEEEVEKAAERIKKERMIEAFEKRGETFKERISRISDALLLKITDQNIVDMIDYMSQTELSIDEGTDIIYEDIEDLKFSIE